MKFSIKFTRIGNKFFFISNLAEWHFSCEKEYNKIWLKKTAPLTKEEINALDKIAPLLKKYNFGEIDGKPIWLGIPFITSPERKTWNEIKKWVSKKELLTINDTFKTFEEKFDKIWKEENLKLKKFKGTLIKKLPSENFKNTISEISNFYNTKLSDRKKINIYLLAIPEESSGIGGNAALKNKGIILEVSKIQEPKKYLPVIAHEITHGFLEHNSLKKITKATQNLKLPSLNLIKQRGKIGTIRELILCSLIPNGYLGEKHFGNKVTKFKKEDFRKKTWENLEKFTIAHLYPIAKDYIENKKTLDKHFITTTAQLVKEFLK